MEKFIKIVLILMLFAISGLSNIANAQNIQAYSDATIVGGGFSYNVQLSFTPMENNEALHAGGWIVKLISVNPDSKGYYHKGKTNRYFSCSELGSICNPSKFYMVMVKVKYQCENNEEKSVVFYGNNREEKIVVRQKPNTKCSIELVSVQVGGVTDEPIYRKRINEIEYPQQNTSTSNSNIPSSSSSTKSQQTINPNDPNPMTNDSSRNYQAPKSSTSNSSKQLTEEEQQSIQQGVAVGTELISDGVTLISDALDVKKQRRESQYYSETDKVMTIGYSFSTSSWLGVDVSMFNPQLGKLGWGVTLRFNPSIFWSDFNVGIYGDYRDHYLYDDDYSYTLLETGKKTSFNIGGSLNIGLSSWLFVQIGGGIGAVSTYSRYEITNATKSYLKDNIGDKFYTRKDEDRIMGFCNENNLVLRFTNVLCLKSGFATYNLKSPEFTLGILFMPGQ